MRDGDPFDHFRILASPERLLRGVGSIRTRVELGILGLNGYCFFCKEIRNHQLWFFNGHAASPKLRTRMTAIFLSWLYGIVKYDRFVASGKLILIHTVHLTKTSMHLILVPCILHCLPFPYITDVVQCLKPNSHLASQETRRLPRSSKDLSFS
jgi:hypothetical protein